MTTPQQKLNNLIPDGLTANSSRQDIIDITYKNRVGENMIRFIQYLKMNILRKRKGNMMCPPRVTWTPTTPVTLDCWDNIRLFSVLGNSTFLKIANTYANNVQIHKKYLHMKSQGKSYPRPLTPKN